MNQTTHDPRAAHPPARARRLPRVLRELVNVAAHADALAFERRRRIELEAAFAARLEAGETVVQLLGGGAK